VDKKTKMKNTLTILSLVAVLAICYSAAEKTSGIEGQPTSASPSQSCYGEGAEATVDDDKSNATADTTPRVTGIGGIFFCSDNPQKTRDWYSQNLGLQTTEYGSTFEFRNANRPDEINYLQWSPFKTGTTYLAPSPKEFMINYRVQNIEGLVRNLRASGTVILDSIETYDYGKFVHILDPDSNKIELWEPIDHVLTSFGGKTTK
jgi:predicted enzyme related to lactoylglutathione lyase